MAKNKERRKYDRYGTEAEVHFKITFDAQTKIKYQILDDGAEKILSKKYSAISKDVSASGLRFLSSQRLHPGDVLRIEVYVLDSKEPILMDGEVRWSEETASGGGYETGVRLTKCNDKDVEQSIYFDDENKVIWSEVLESIVGSFKKLALKKRSAKKYK